jgi:membrane protein YqaA with SNARE-associated domain
LDAVSASRLGPHHHHLGMIRALRALRRWARSPRGRGSLFAASLLESTILPIPLEAALVPMMAADRRRIVRLATIALGGCLAGGAIGYLVGATLFEAVGRPLLEHLGYVAAFEEARRAFERGGFWIILWIGITPVPCQAGALAAGATRYDPLLFLLASTLARGIRYYGLGALVALFGERVQRMMVSADRRVALVAIAIAIVACAVLLWP